MNMTLVRSNAAPISLQDVLRLEGGNDEDDLFPVGSIRMTVKGVASPALTSHSDVSTPSLR